MNAGEKYDFLILGSGLAGLSSAIILAKEGYSVCVLEKNRQFGGNLQTFARDKAVFDTGVHYIGSLDIGQNLYRYFSYLGVMNDLDLVRMDEDGFDMITFDGDPVQYPHAMGHERFVDELVKLFPESRQELEMYIEKIKEVCESISLYTLHESEQHDIPPEYISASAFEFISKTITDPRLQQVLAGSNMLYAGIKDKTTLYQHAVIVNSYIESAWKCVDGGSQITKSLIRQIKALGGEVFNYSEVSRLHVLDGAIEKVECTNGNVYSAGKVISNIHPAATMSLISSGTIKESFRARMNNLENGIAAFSIHLVFHPQSFPYLNKNYYHHFTNDVWSSIDYTEENWPRSIMAIVSASSRSEKYADSMTIWTYMKYSEVEKWKDTFNIIPQHEESRGEEYEKFKVEKTERLLNAAEKIFPGLRSQVRSVHTSTPLSYRDYINTPEGSMYGVIKDFNHPLTTFISPKTKLSNLYFTGQNMSTHGILGVTISAFNTCSEFIGKNELIRKVNNSGI